jgi:MoaA/NifB/PqqE/SkfB family radical SAM enzyme
MINKRLFEYYNINTEKNLRIQSVCSRPYDTLLIDKQGSCYACECTAWLPQSVGNIQVQGIDEILASATRKQLQESVANGRYNYCNSKLCGYIKRGVAACESKDTFNIRLAVDDSCNLSCPSCRTERIFVNRGKPLDRKKKWIDKIVDWIVAQTRHIRVTIGSDGDPFASLVYRYFMTRMQTLKPHNVTFDLQTNGLLLSKMYNRHEYIFDNLETLNISVDGASRETYENLRRGGSWTQIQHNLRFVSSRTKRYDVALHMVVQKENWSEMLLMYKWLQHLEFDKMHYSLIQDWSTGANLDDKFLKDDECKYAIEYLKGQPNVYFQGLF